MVVESAGRVLCAAVSGACDRHDRGARCATGSGAWAWAWACWSPRGLASLRARCLCLLCLSVSVSVFRGVSEIRAARRGAVRYEF